MVDYATRIGIHILFGGVNLVIFIELCRRYIGSPSEDFVWQNMFEI